MKKKDKNDEKYPWVKRWMEGKKEKKKKKKEKGKKEEIEKRKEKTRKRIREKGIRSLERAPQ